MQGKKKKTKKRIKVDDLNPAKDPKGGMTRGPPRDLKWLLKHLQLGQEPTKIDSKRKSAS
jgi:hypothetical protein